jgi:hypothetical protein
MWSVNALIVCQISTIASVARISTRSPTSVWRAVESLIELDVTVDIDSRGLALGDDESRGGECVERGRSMVSNAERRHFELFERARVELFDELSRKRSFVDVADAHWQGSIGSDSAPVTIVSVYGMWKRDAIWKNSPLIMPAGFRQR